MTAPTLFNRLSDPLIVDTHAISKRYGDKHALDGLELTVPEDAVYLLVGENGAGKTTTLRMILDLVRPNSGSMRVFGLDPARQGAQIRAAVGYVPEDRGPNYGHLKVTDLLHHHAGYYTQWDAAYASELIDGLGVDVDARYGAMSKGEARRVQLVMALAHRPQLLLLDEPTDGLDPVLRDRFFAMLANHLASSPTTMLISSHLVHEQELFADHLGVISKGKLTAQIDRDKLHHSMRRYVVEADPDRIGDAGLGDSIISKNMEAGGIDWVVLGDKNTVTTTLENAGGTVRHVKRLALTEAARALMTAGARDSQRQAQINETESTDERKHG